MSVLHGTMQTMANAQRIRAQSMAVGSPVELRKSQDTAGARRLYERRSVVAGDKCCQGTPSPKEDPALEALEQTMLQLAKGFAAPRKDHRAGGTRKF